jgi:hypothetical protein
MIVISIFHLILNVSELVNNNEDENILNKKNNKKRKEDLFLPLSLFFSLSIPHLCVLKDSE